MKRQLLKRRLIPFVISCSFLLLYIALLNYANRGWNGYTITDDSGIEYETAKVLEVLEDNTVVDETIEGRRRGSMLLGIEILTGRYKGNVVQVENYLSAMYNVYVTEGDKVSVRIDTTGVEEYQVSIYNYNRSGILIGLILVFAVSLIIIGGWQGFRALAGLIFTFVNVVYLLLPLTLKGYPSLPVTIILVNVTCVVCYYLLGGYQPKTIGASLGCVCGISFSAIFGSIASHITHISAYQMDEAEALILTMSNTNLRLEGLFLSGILIASIGAIMDTAMSVASAMDEIKIKKPEATMRELFSSGMKVGRDTTGTMANTLVLAFAGSSLNMMLLIYSYDVSYNQLMNTDFIVIELVRGIAGSMGVILTVPCVAIITAFVLQKMSKKIRSEG